ncbi:hypothetical protein DFQ28_001869 [Apophysomyces sp. BC1034]|nr:hypothetical protein DFQ30_002299 [Apophysomyces sp. BC1015]KAG0180064.1 hypothetical protein DFQ29_001285 [Apophysomyces sp. BC1021]KAG0190576.1 hypothetical protein DFQ28_001869 [Apophysomyces sp. BC1034]
MPSPTALRLALLVCDTPADSIRCKHGDYPILFANIFNEVCPTGLKIEWKFFDVCKQEYPSLPDVIDGKYDGIVISGSTSSAYKDEPWILKLVEFVKTVRAAPRVKIIGVCFGHQIIARAAGGRCIRNPNGWERLNQVHQDHVPDLPPKFHSLATTAPHTPIHALVSDDNRCLTIQGHPEIGRAMVRDLLEYRRELGTVPRDYADSQVSILDKQGPDMEDTWLVRQFIDFLQGKLQLEDDSVTPDTGSAHGPNVKIGYD